MDDSNIDMRSLRSCNFHELYACHLKAFKDYPFQWSKEALLKTIHRRGFDPELSFGAFHKDELVSFTWNGIGTFKGLRTAYDTGTGTVEEYRGKGLASKIFEYSIPFLKAAGVQQYILEVLEDNEKAFSVYSKQGFTVSRKFECFRINVCEWKIPERSFPKEIQLKEIDLGYRTQMQTMIDFDLSWQNNFEALSKNPGDLKIIGAFEDNILIAYAIIEPHSGDIPQLAVTTNKRRKGISSMLLRELKKSNKAEIVKVINIGSDQEAIKEFVLKNGIPKLVSQFEMVKNL